MPTDDRLDDLLEGAAGTTPAPDPGFADDLEARLLAAHPGRPVGLTGAGRRRMAAPLLAAAAVLLALMLVVGREDSAEVLRLQHASDARIVLPDGSVAVAVEGLALPDGTVIVAGDDPVAIAGTVVEPGERAEIRDGRVEVVRSGRDDGAAARDPGRGDADEVADPGPGSPPPAGTDEPPPTTRPTSRPAPLPGDGPVPVPPKPQAPPPTSPPDPPPSTTTTSRPAEPVRLDLRAERTDRGTVRLRWTAYRGADFARYVLVRSEETKGEGPTEGQVVFTSRDQRLVTTDDRPPAGSGRVVYRLVVLDDADRVVGRSDAATPS